MCDEEVAHKAGVDKGKRQGLSIRAFGTKEEDLIYIRYAWDIYVDAYKLNNF